MNNIIDLCTVECSNDTNIGNIGLLIKNNQINVNFPRCFVPNSNFVYLRKDILNLLSVLQKYQHRVNSNAISKDKDHVLYGDGDLLPLKSIFWIINDYISYGIFTEIESYYSKEKKGKINWNRTIKNIQSYHSDGNSIYLDFIVKKNKTDDTLLLTRIHKYCINICIDLIGWLYPQINKLDNIIIPLSHAEMITFLKHELSYTNNDRKKMLIQNLINLLTKSGEKKSKDTLHSFYISKFDNVWEDILRVVLGNTPEKDYYTYGSWYLEDEDMTYSYSNLKPDIILKSKNKTYVLDAKYYKYGVTYNPSDLPNSSDISKQFNYSESIKNRHDLLCNESYDAFIIPYDASKKNNKTFEYFGYARLKGIENKYIIGILADIKTLMYLYTKPSSYNNYRKDIINIIHTSINKINSKKNKTQ